MAFKRKISMPTKVQHQQMPVKSIDPKSLQAKFTLPRPSKDNYLSLEAVDNFTDENLSLETHIIYENQIRLASASAIFSASLQLAKSNVGGANANFKAVLSDAKRSKQNSPTDIIIANSAPMLLDGIVGVDSMMTCDLFIADIIYDVYIDRLKYMIECNEKFLEAASNPKENLVNAHDTFIMDGAYLTHYMYGGKLHVCSKCNNILHFDRELINPRSKLRANNHSLFDCMVKSKEIDLYKRGFTYNYDNDSHYNDIIESGIEYHQQPSYSSLLLPAWVEQAINGYKTHNLGDSISLGEYLRHLNSGKDDKNGE